MNAIYMLTIFIFTNSGQTLTTEPLHVFTDAIECASYIDDVQNQTIARLTTKLRKQVADGDVHVRAVCVQGLTS